MNAFRQTPDSRLDRQYLRVSAVYRLLIRQRIGKARAVELLEQRKVKNPRALVGFWLEGHQFRSLSTAA